MYRLEVSIKKLERLQREFEKALEDLYATQKLTSGQPMNDKRNGDTWFKKMEQKEEKCRKLNKEIEEQKERIKHLELKITRKEEGLNRYGTGLKLCLGNIEKIKAEINNPDTKYRKETIKKYKEYVNTVESLKDLEIPVVIKNLVKAGTLSEWNKHPNVFFITDLDRVAIIYVDGKVGVSKRYFPRTNKGKLVTKEILEYIRRHLDDDSK